MLNVKGVGMGSMMFFLLAMIALISAVVWFSLGEQARENKNAKVLAELKLEHEVMQSSLEKIVKDIASMTQALQSDRREQSEKNDTLYSKVQTALELGHQANMKLSKPAPKSTEPQRVLVEFSPKSILRVVNPKPLSEKKRRELLLKKTSNQVKELSN